MKSIDVTKTINEKADEVRIPRGRICYQAPEGIPSSSPAFPSMVLVYDGRGPPPNTMMRGL